jgi:hypothetical protein
MNIFYVMQPSQPLKTVSFAIFDISLQAYTHRSHVRPEAQRERERRERDGELLSLFF